MPKNHLISLNTLYDLSYMINHVMYFGLKLFCLIKNNLVELETK